jgi:hypothetical protein
MPRLAKGQAELSMNGTAITIRFRRKKDAIQNYTVLSAVFDLGSQNQMEAERILPTVFEQDDAPFREHLLKQKRPSGVS